MMTPLHSRLWMKPVLVALIALIGTLFLSATLSAVPTPAMAQTTNLMEPIADRCPNNRAAIPPDALGGTPVINVPAAYGPNQYPFLVERIVFCVQNTLLFALMGDPAVADDGLIGTMLELMRTVFYGALTLAIILFGMQITLGALQNPVTSFFILALKGAALIAAPEMLEMIVNGAVNLMLTICNVIFQSMDPAALSISGAPAGEATVMLSRGCYYGNAFARIDCMIGRLFGIQGAQMVLRFGILGFFGGLFFAGFMGFQAFLFGIMFLITILLAFFRAVNVYLVSLTTLVIQVILLILVLPTMLFRYTDRFFDNIIKQIISTMLHPMMLFGVLAFALPIINAIAFGAYDQQMSARTVSLHNALWGSTVNEWAYGATPDNMQPPIFDDTKPKEAGGLRTRNLFTWSMPISEQQINALAEAIANPQNSAIFGGTNSVEQARAWLSQRIAETSMFGQNAANQAINSITTILTIPVRAFDWAGNLFYKIKFIISAFIAGIFMAIALEKTINYIPDIAQSMVGSVMQQRVDMGKNKIAEDAAENTMNWLDQRLSKV